MPEPGQRPAGHDDLPGFVGKGAFFEKDKDTGIANITDGTSNTIMVVEASEAVPWTKPDSDLPFDPEASPRSSAPARRIRAASTSLFADGSVRFFKNTIDLHRLPGPDHQGRGRGRRGWGVLISRGGDSFRTSGSLADPSDRGESRHAAWRDSDREGRSSMGRGIRGLVLGAILILAASPGVGSRPGAGRAGGAGQGGAPGALCPARGAGQLPGVRRARRPPGRLEGFGRLQAANETKLGPLIEDVFRQFIVMSQAPIQPADLIGGFKLFARQGMAVGVWGKDPEISTWSWSSAAAAGPSCAA